MNEVITMEKIKEIKKIEQTIDEQITELKSRVYDYLKIIEQHSVMIQQHQQVIKNVNVEIDKLEAKQKVPVLKK